MSAHDANTAASDDRTVASLDGNVAKATTGESDDVEDFDDNISLTSTTYEPETPDEDYTVEMILNVGFDENHSEVYLVKWENYGPERSTWEPEENLGKQLVEDMWVNKHLLPGYDPLKEELYKEAVEMKADRHRRRNAKRRRLGLALTHPLDDPLQQNAALTETSLAPPGDECEKQARDHADLRTGQASEDIDIAKTEPITADSIDIAKTEPATKPITEPITAQPKTKKKKRKRAAQTSISQDIPKAGSSSTLAASPSADPAIPNQPDTQILPELRKFSKRKKSDKAAKMSPDLPGIRPVADVDTRKPARDGQSIKQLKSLRLSRERPTTNPSRPDLTLKTGADTAKVGNTATVSTEKKRRASTTLNEERTGTRLYTHQQRRISLQHERDKRDSAIDTSKLSAKLFPITQGPSGRQQCRVDETAIVSTKQIPASNTSTPGSPGSPDSLVDKHSAIGKKPKKRKTVRFPDDDGQDGSRMSATLAKDNIKNSDVNERDSSAAEKAVQPHDIPSLDKNLILEGRKTPIAVTFSGVPKGNISLEAFHREDNLQIGHLCFAKSLIPQYGSLWREVLCHGNVCAGTAESVDAALLATVAERLKSMGSGLFLARPSYGLVLYPTQCDEWKEESLGFQSTGPGNAVLRYVIFGTLADFSVFLRPVGVLAPEIDAHEGVSRRQRLMQTFFQLGRDSYLPLFPSKAHRTETKRNLFLVFPASLTDSMREMGLWFRDVDPQCSLFFSSNAGSWQAFYDKIVAKSEVGAVIVHELVSWSLRCFPSILGLAENENCQIWSLSQSILSPPMFPSLERESSINPHPTVPGHISWTRLFPRGSVILVTPSFIVSEPRRTYELFEWFLQTRCSTTSSLKLVTGWNIRKYLEELAEEKACLRDELQQDLGLKTTNDREIAANLKGITTEQCEYRYKTWLFVTENFSIHELTEPTSIFGDDNPIIYAPEFIDANDEQSLLNWFGWWSMLRLDQFQSFHVVGSNIATKRKGSERARRTIRIPRFSPETVADPDMAREQALAPDNKMISKHSATAATTMTITAPAMPRSQIFPDGSCSDMVKYLMQYNNNRPLFCKCYWFPVFWTDIEEAYQMGDLCPKNNTINDWFSFGWPFSTKETDFRAYTGLFYTVDETWDRMRAKPGEKERRHPWVVIYRLVESQKWPFRETELIIWDFRLKDRTTRLHERDLDSAQQAVIRHVRMHGPEKNPHLGLTRIWIGSELSEEDRWQQHGCSSDGQPQNELDVTIGYLDSVMSDPQAVLPSSEMMLVERGYSQVLGNNESDIMDTESCSSSGSLMHVDSEKSTETGRGGGVDKASDYDEEPVKMVFHAPRSTRPCRPPPHHKAPTRCCNRLYEKARLARLNGSRATMMAYEFRPTMDWYMEQWKEGRGYEHIHVNSWETFFRMFKIGTGDRQGPESPMGSVKSAQSSRS